MNEQHVAGPQISEQDRSLQKYCLRRQLGKEHSRFGRDEHRDLETVTLERQHAIVIDETYQEHKSHNESNPSNRIFLAENLALKTVTQTELPTKRTREFH